MAVCVVADVSGALTATVTDVTSCAGYVMLTPAEYADVMSMPAWSLSAADGASIGVAILTCWALGWSTRALVSVLKSTDEGNENA